jgi:peptidoglycan/LPS O-acetylase OafA/YrhL
MSGNVVGDIGLGFCAGEAARVDRSVEPMAGGVCADIRSAESRVGGTSGLHLKYLEGLRGLAAIVVTLQHIYFHTLWGTNLTGWQAKLAILLGWMFPGRASVAVFIVLSGYLLMRPVVREGSGQLAGGVWAYLGRRARRILPPYYAALIFSIALILLFRPLRGALSPEWVDAGPAFGTNNPAIGVKDIVAHLLLVHNLSWKWASKIDPPMWTIGTEWQIYFLFPLILLPVWRQVGNVGIVAVGLGIGLGFFFLTGKGHATAPWFLGLFAMGAAAAARKREKPVRGFGWLAAVLLAIYAVITFEAAFNMLRFLTVEGLFGLWPFSWAFDVVIGIATG